MTENDTPKPGVTSTNPADTAQPGGVFRDLNGAIWTLAEDDDDDARRANLIRMVPEDDTSVAACGYERGWGDAQAFAEWLIAEARDDAQVVDAQVVDASDPVQLRRAADLLQSLYQQATWSVAQIEALSEVITLIANRADRLDTDTKDRELAEQITGEQFELGRKKGTWVKPWKQQPAEIQERYIAIALAGIKAGRESAVQG